MLVLQQLKKIGKTLLPMNVNLLETSKYLDKLATANANPEQTESYILNIQFIIKTPKVVN